MTPNSTNFRPNHQIRAAFRLQVDGGVHAVDVALVELAPQQLNGFAKPLEMDHLTLPEELDDIVYVRVIGKPEDVVIGDPGLLLWYAQSFATIFILKFWNKRLISAILSLKYSYIFGFLLNWPV